LFFKLIINRFQYQKSGRPRKTPITWIYIFWFRHKTQKCQINIFCICWVISNDHLFFMYFFWVICFLGSSEFQWKIISASNYFFGQHSMFFFSGRIFLADGFFWQTDFFSGGRDFTTMVFFRDFFRLFFESFLRFFSTFFRPFLRFFSNFFVDNLVSVKTDIKNCPHPLK